MLSVMHNCGGKASHPLIWSSMSLLQSWKLRPSRVGVESRWRPPPPYVTFDMSPGEPFVPGTLTAEVRVYVVYLLER